MLRGVGVDSVRTCEQGQPGWGFCQRGGFAKKAIEDNYKEMIITHPGQAKERGKGDEGDTQFFAMHLQVGTIWQNVIPINVEARFGKRKTEWSLSPLTCPWSLARKVKTT